MQHSLPVKIASMQMHRRGNSYLGSPVFELLYCSSTTKQKLSLVVCIKIILKVHREKNFLDLFVHNRKADVCVCVFVEVRVKGGGIPVLSKAEVEKRVEEGVYVKANLQNFLHLFFFVVFFFPQYGACYYIFANLPCMCFLSKLVKPSGLQGEEKCFLKKI